MSLPPDLLLITWNRSGYVRKTLERLLSDPTDFRLYCWDNGSEEETKSLIADLDDPRIATKHFNKDNVGQREPCSWFIESAKSDLVGKIDDDVLLPHGWTARIAPMLRKEPKFGMLGCWIFMEEDFDESLLPINSVTIGDFSLLRLTTSAGCSFLSRLEVLKKYMIINSQSYGIPFDRPKMTYDGLISGLPLPIMMAHHMDDPRSPHCIYGDKSDKRSLTGRTFGFKTQEEYGTWIAADARYRLSTPFRRQFRRMKLEHNHSLRNRVTRKALKLFGLWK